MTPPTHVYAIFWNVDTDREYGQLQAICATLPGAIAWCEAVDFDYYCAETAHGTDEDSEVCIEKQELLP